jgi:hypothetical protein
MPVELGFILEQMATVAQGDPSLAEQQPWKAAKDGDYAWLGTVVDKHYHGDDSDAKVLLGGILKSFAGMTMEPTRRKRANISMTRQSDSSSPLHRLQLPADDRVAPLSRVPRIQRSSSPAATGTSCA